MYMQLTVFISYPTRLCRFFIELGTVHAFRSTARQKNGPWPFATMSNDLEIKYGKFWTLVDIPLLQKQ